MHCSISRAERKVFAIHQASSKDGSEILRDSHEVVSPLHSERRGGLRCDCLKLALIELARMCLKLAAFVQERAFVCSSVQHLLITLRDHIGRC